MTRGIFTVKTVCFSLDSTSIVPLWACAATDIQAEAHPGGTPPRSQRRDCARQRIKERGNCTSGYPLTSIRYSNCYPLLVTDSFHNDRSGAVDNTVRNQVDDELVHAFAVTKADKLAPGFHSDMRIEVRSTHLVDRTVTYAFKVAPVRLNWKCVPEARTREDEKVIDQYFHSFAATLQVRPCT